MDPNAPFLENVSAQHLNNCVMAVLPSSALGARIGGVVAEVGYGWVAFGALERRGVVKQGHTDVMLYRDHPDTNWGAGDNGRTVYEEDRGGSAHKSVTADSSPISSYRVLRGIRDPWPEIILLKECSCRFTPSSI
eukprot:GFKZ01009464.1.p1 GENE.GFKZ01009464.1~~GFKZ01009464.1.p1  ORF type:complete len:135 (+),score=8.59 GFKZ01009464.1:317-721(+)